MQTFKKYNILACAWCLSTFLASECYENINYLRTSFPRTLYGSYIDLNRMSHNLPVKQLKPGEP